MSSFAFAATNPCHVWEMALALAQSNRTVTFYSGYPEWRLGESCEGLSIRTRSSRTLVTYGLLRVPERFRPSATRLFRWQDQGFDRAVAGILEPGNGVFHGLPGQCLVSFERAKELGMITILNHASGPAEEQQRLVAPEYVRAGLPGGEEALMGEQFRERLKKETELADYHCAASSVVADQLVSAGVEVEKILKVPYGADPKKFKKREKLPERFRVLFAGILSLRKGIHYLLKAVEDGSEDWEVNLYGPSSQETENDFSSYQGTVPIRRRGAVSQEHLAEEMRKASVLVLPSAEEAFGLVVVQALQCGVPCIVSDRVGAKDLIRHRENGSVVPFGDSAALRAELDWWSQNPMIVAGEYSWDEPAQIFIREHRRVLPEAF